MNQNEETHDLLIGLQELWDKEAPESDLELQKSQEQVNLLDNTESVPEINLRAPSEVLNEYSNYERTNQKVQREIDEFKEKHKEVFEAYQALLDIIKDNETKQTNLKEELTESMQNAGLKTLSDDLFKVTFVAATTRNNFDTTSFKTKYPVLFQQFTKVSDVKAYVKISGTK